MTQSPDYEDGELEYGSPLLTITPKAGANPVRSTLTAFEAIADAELSFSDDSKEVDQTDQFGQYNAGFGIPQKRAGSCTIQLPSGRRAYPGDTFTVDISGNDRITADVTLFQITKASHPYQKEGYRSQEISFFIRKYALDNTTLNQPAAA